MANQKYTNLKNYILRKLGSPVINIEISDDQLEDCIDEAISKFHAEHYNGVYIGFLPFQLLQGVTSYQLEDNVHEVIKIVSSKSLSFDWSGDESLLLNSFYLGNENYPIFKNSIVDVEVYRQQFKMVSDYFEVPIQFDYNSPSRKLYLYVEPENNLDVFLKVYKSDDDEIEDYLTDIWVKSYARELARKQWGINLMKYEGANLPGGAQFNYSGILELAETELERLRLELEEKFTLPPDPQMG